MLASDFAASLLNPAAALPKAVKGDTPRRYAVYRNNVTVGLVRAMEANFPAIRRLLGEEYFAGLTREFVQKHPPQSPLLFTYGEAFADFLVGQADLASYPYLADVARLEQQWRLSYHAADASVLQPAVFTGLSEDALMALRFAPHPAFALLVSPFAAHSIFAANRANGETPTIDPTAAETVLVTRPYYDVLTRTITMGQHAFLAALASGETFSEAVEHGYETESEFDPAENIRLMLEAGVMQHHLS